MILKYVAARRSSFRWMILENVKRLSAPGLDGSSNLDHCVTLLRENHFEVMVCEVDSKIFGRPHSRPRLYLLCLCRHQLQLVGKEAKEIFTTMSAVLDLLTGHQPLHLDQLLLPESHPSILALYRGLEEKGQKGDDDSLPPPAKRSKTKWAVKHSLAFDAAGLDWTARSPFRDPTLTCLFPGALELTHRQIDLLDRLNVQLPEQSPVCVDLSVSLQRAKKTIGRTGCFSSGCMPWLAHRGRFARPVECFRIMGLDFGEHEAELANFNGSLVRDLAGNAFDSSSFLAAWCALQAGLSQMYKST